MWQTQPGTLRGSATVHSKNKKKFKNMSLLSACQALLMTNNSIMIATTGLAGLALTPEKTPAMHVCEHPLKEAAFVIQWHILGMFVPPFFTGGLFTLQGWERLSLLAVPSLIAVGVSLLWLGLRRRAPRPA